MGERSRSLRLVGQMVILPWVTFSWFLGSVTRMIQGMQQAVDGSIDAMPADLSRLRQFDPTAAGARSPGSAANPEKESEIDNCGTDDCSLRLIQYTIVTIKRGEERILHHGQTLVRDVMTQCEFDTVVVAEYVSLHGVPPEDRRYLRVWSEILETWQKQSLHYEEKQLAILQQISNKIGPPVIIPADAVE
jgi:hypothetical protein